MEFISCVMLTSAIGSKGEIQMLSYLEYKLITSIPLSSSIYELRKNSGISSYSIAYDLAKKLARMKIIRIENAISNGRSISRIYPGEAYPSFKDICDKYFAEYYSKATEILKEQIGEISQENHLNYRIIGGQEDTMRAYADIQIAIPGTEAKKWKRSIKNIETNMNELGLTIEPKKQNRFLLRKLQVIPIPFKHINEEIKTELKNKNIEDIHYGDRYANLIPYFLHLTGGTA